MPQKQYATSRVSQLLRIFCLLLPIAASLLSTRDRRYPLTPSHLMIDGGTSGRGRFGCPSQDDQN